MATIIVSTYVTLDGVMEAPEDWLGPFWADPVEDYALAQVLGAESLLIGRATYDIFAESWPQRSGEFADKMNAMPKYVVATALDEVTWDNTTVLSGDPSETVKALKRDLAGQILVYGSAQLTRELMAHGLVDELRLWTFPVVLGTGVRLFPEGTAPAGPFALAAIERFETGLVILSYRPA